MSGPRYTMDSDGDVDMSIPQPIFEWERYVEKIQHRCTTTGETFENVVATVKGCLKRGTLKNLAVYVLKKPLASVTDVGVMNVVKVRCHTLKNEAFRYYEDFNAFMEDNGLQGLIGTGMPCLILSGGGDEPLLGRDVLEELGIDVEQQLAQLAGPALLDGNAPPKEHIGAVRVLLEEFPDVWREAVGADPSAKVEPLRVKLRPDAVPYRSVPRKYAPLQAGFIRDYVKALMDEGPIEQSNSARMFIPIAGTMPSIAAQADAFQGKKMAYSHQLGFRKEQWTPLHFQSQVQATMALLIPHSALVRVDDVILFGATIAELLQTLRSFFETVTEANFKLNIVKSSLFELEILWCGRLIFSEGIRDNPSRVSALEDLPLPVTVADLQYFVCATNWLHDSLPDYSRIIGPLQAKQNAERKRIRRCSRNALNVPTDWTADEEAAYQGVVSLVKASALMGFPDPDAQLLLFTDASATGYSIIVAQVRHWDVSLPVDEQNH
ncbi:hypothetical protein PHPALM_30531 [Phytophthora palmivora]|uniref:Reverse transcriptase domain-containing protein n=1 Tax=Phytophthora palmivora TaxID=4796 RepID=A0A2P4X500_9STRA|nr:hypothetical protein PHPALM_30531 [Phytophthora palmivora]